MAYCLRSLVHILEQVMYPQQHYKNWVLDHAKIPQIQSLLEYATFLRDFFDTTSPLLLDSMESLEDQIMEAAGKAEDAIESHITDHILLNPEGHSFMILPPDLEEVLKVFAVAKQELIAVKAAGQRWGDVSLPVSSMVYPDSKNMVVGVTEDVNQLRSQLTARTPELNVIPIVGMGGSGKTTLARILYDEHASSKSQFDCCAWVTVSQTYDPKQILQTLVDLIGKPQQENADLITALHKSLFRRRYLIVLDDIWSCKAWDDFRQAFAQDNNRSRIILTTRDNTVANYVNLNSHQMHFLSKDDSWELLSGKVFGGRSCPRELEDVGKRITWNCGGLPLALQVIAGLLSQSEKRKDLWEQIAYNVSSFASNTNDQFSGIFSWSFINLPHYLKPCFLYMGAFPEDYSIRATTITRLWIAEGFLYPIPDKTLEKAAEIHLNALVDRNLIFVRKKKSNGKAKSYGIHDILRDMCLKKAEEKKFIYFKDLETDILQEDTSNLRCEFATHIMSCLSQLLFSRIVPQVSRVIVQLPDLENNDEYGSLKLTSFARSFLLLTGYQESERFVSRLCLESSLLRVLCAPPISEFHQAFLQLVNLRYIYLWIEEGLVPRSISVLRNLQTLIVKSLESIEILEDLPQLRHLWFKSLGQKTCERSFRVHKNLQSLSWIPLITLSRFIGKLPNLRKLGIAGQHSNHTINFTSFEKLETLQSQYGYKPNKFYFPSETVFPCSIKKLTFSYYEIITQTILDAIGSLPNLQILKFHSVGFENYTWEPSEDGFLQLQYLKFEKSRMENLLATEIHFPVLRHLIFNNCRTLTEIPGDIGGIVTLEIIEVDECKTCVFESARSILEEQSQLGNTFLQLLLGCALEEEEKEGEEEKLRAMVKNNALELRDYNFRITTVLPQSLKSLRLKNCALSQTSLHAIGILPELEFLELYWCEFESSTWVPSEGGFCKLQCLEINGDTLENWVATEIHFPVLRSLVLIECYGIDEIPNRLGRIETLESLKVHECYRVLFDSARNILEEQRQLGNTLLQLQLGFVVQR